MNELFDKLQEYIDKKIEGVEGGFQDLFDEYGLKDILPHLDEIQNVSTNIDIIDPVGSNIGAVINVDNNMDAILATPGYVDDINDGVQEAEQYFIGTQEQAGHAFKWAQEEFNTPVDDGNNTGYSSYHWALTAQQSTYQLTMRGKWTPESGSYPTPNAHGDYWFVEETGEFDNDLWYAGDALIWKDDGDGQEWIHKRESVHWLQIVGKPGAYTPKPHYHSEYVQVDNLLPVSAGPASAGYPIKLNVDGHIHNSMLKLPVTYIVDTFTPVPTDEYPSTGIYNPGASWMISGVHINDGYTFFTGELIGRTIRNGDFLIWAAEGWIIQYDKLMPDTYLKRNGDYPMWGNLQMGLNRITDLSDGIDPTDAVNVRQIEQLADVVFLETEYVVVSAGATDQGKPILLNEHGLVDPTMISFNALIIVGSWNPEDGIEYPTLPEIKPGYSWKIEGTGDDGYTFTSGDLKDKFCKDGDWMIYGQSGWILNPIRITPEDYYRVDGTNPIIADFNAGGHKITRISDGYNDDDAVSKRQMETGLATKAPVGHVHTPTTIQPQGAGSGLDADRLDGYDSTDFMMVNANINPGQIQPQGDTSGLDADTVDGRHASEFFNVTDGIAWGHLTGVPTEFAPVKAAEQTIGGIRIWADGNILNIANTDYVAP